MKMNRKGFVKLVALSPLAKFIGLEMEKEGLLPEGHTAGMDFADVTFPGGMTITAPVDFGFSPATGLLLEYRVDGGKWRKLADIEAKPAKGGWADCVGKDGDQGIPLKIGYIDGGDYGYSFDFQAKETGTYEFRVADKEGE